MEHKRRSQSVRYKSRHNSGKESIDEGQQSRQESQDESGKVEIDF